MSIFTYYGKDNEQAQKEALQKAQLQRQLQQAAPRENALGVEGNGALSKTAAPEPVKRKRPVLNALKTVAGWAVDPIARKSEEELEEIRKKQPFYQDPADAFWTGMAIDTADAMMGNQPQSNALRMMGEARMRNPQTQMQYLDYQIKQQQLDDLEAQRQINIKLGQPAQLDTTAVPGQPSSSVTTPAVQSDTPYIDQEEREAQAYLDSDNASMRAIGRDLMAKVGDKRRALANKGGQKVDDDRTLRTLLPQIATQGADGKWVLNPNANPQLVNDYNDAYYRRHGPTEFTDPVTKARTLQQGIAPTDLLVPEGMPQPNSPENIYREQFVSRGMQLDLEGLDATQATRTDYITRIANATEQMARIENTQSPDKQGLALDKLNIFTSFTGEGESQFSKWVTQKLAEDVNLTAQEKEYIQAGQNLIAAILRPETGAVIGPSEVSQTAKLVFKTHDMNKTRQDITDNYRSDKLISIIDSMPDAWKFKPVRLQQWYNVFGEKEFNRTVVDVLKNSNFFKYGDPNTLPDFGKKTSGGNGQQNKSRVKAGTFTQGEG